MHHGAELGLVLTMCAVLVLGAATKGLSEKLKVPYSIALLLLGIAAGTALDALPHDAPGHALWALLARDEQVTPDLILFVFLPVLVFESAWSLDVHAFRKDAGPVLLLAGPVLLASTFAVGAMLVGLTSLSWQWGWLPALVFGALISATDPVAVVALLRELGAPKRLGLLIEGESLLNDGTSIVVFSLLLGLLTGEAEASALAVLSDFVRVAGGGLVIGVGLAGLTALWLGRVFNQPLVEITLILALAYASMIVAEGLLHVSGVIAVVAAGLFMAGPGRTRISPEVTHFLHRFLGMLAYMANTLIFFLVGMVIAGGAGATGWADWGLVAAAFVGVVAIRVGLVLLVRPVFGGLSAPVTLGEGLVMGWGGLRGAVSLALALLVAGEASIDPVLRRQVVVLATGVVFGTIVLNGSTMGWMLRKLGLDRPPAGDRLAQVTTRIAVLDQVEAGVRRLRTSPDLLTVNWRAVTGELEERRNRAEGEAAAIREELEKRGATERKQGFWRQILSIERAAGWNAFAQGTLGPEAVQVFDHAIDQQLDRVAKGDFEPPEQRVSKLPGWRGLLERWVRGRPGVLDTLVVGTLGLRYELHRAEGMVSASVLRRLNGLEIDPDVADQARDSYARRARRAREQLEDLRTHLPELTRVVETRIARRIQLNLERDSWADLANDGVVDPPTAAAAEHAVEQEMKRLEIAPGGVSLPETAEICRHAPLFAHLDDAAIEKLAALTRERALVPGEVLCRQGDPSDSAFLIARGALAVTVEDDAGPALVEVLGSGQVVGEIGVLTGQPRSATLEAFTTCAIGEISAAGFNELMQSLPGFADGIWEAIGRRRFDNHVRSLQGFEHLGHTRRVHWFESGTPRSLEDGQALPGCELAFVVEGTLVGWSRHQAPALVRPGDSETLTADGPCRVVMLPRAAPGLRTGRL